MEMPNTSSFDQAPQTSIGRSLIFATLHRVETLESNVYTYSNQSVLKTDSDKRREALVRVTIRGYSVRHLRRSSCDQIIT